ncbi:unnamed protein product [Paramecium pentaurelia]|uniref:Uncharacterized protein n=1 Tax=Paramecium pentaurelia TaxID=43138 RepID=A0A8S1V6J3_9CILI|nr:unnamed protein product [Paramecium pentaurelia]
MDYKQLVIYIREDDELETIKKTENEDIVPQLNQQTKQSCQISRNIKKGLLLWKEFYKQELIKNKIKNPYATHNELTSIISQKWKRKKKHKKIVNKLKLKIKQENITELTIQDNNVEQISINNKQKDEIIEKLRTQTFKLIYLNNICELKGEIILEAINNNMQFIYINKSYENNQQDIEDFINSKIIQNNQESQENKQVDKKKDSEDEPIIDENERSFKIINKIMNYL